MKSQTLCEKTVQCVHDFYCDHDVSRMMPGRKDFVSVKEKGKTTHKSTKSSDKQKTKPEKTK